MDQPKQKYEKPQLTTYGSIEAITKALYSSGSGDVPFANAPEDAGDFACHPDGPDSWCASGSGS
jgi:hypothetical protein